MVWQRKKYISGHNFYRSRLYKFCFNVIIPSRKSKRIRINASKYEKYIHIQIFKKVGNASLFYITLGYVRLDNFQWFLSSYLILLIILFMPSFCLHATWFCFLCVTDMCCNVFRLLPYVLLTVYIFCRKWNFFIESRSRKPELSTFLPCLSLCIRLSVCQSALQLCHVCRSASPSLFTLYFTHRLWRNLV